MIKEHLQIITTFLILSVSVKSQIIYPEQIHISLGNSPDEMVITWVTFYDTFESVVWYGNISEGLTMRVLGTTKEFTDESPCPIPRYIHRVALQKLKPRTFYVYRCGSWFGWSPAYIFQAKPTDSDWSPRLVIFGDMGVEGAVSFPYILNEAMDYDVDAIVHVGDIAYNMDMQKGCVGDEFLRMIQPLASFVPYMTTPGNHEQAYNFSHYKNKFSMPGDSEGLFYSFNLGPAHFIAISTEVYYFTEYGIEPLINQFNWLKKDLRKATSIKNRLLRPWIIVFGHRPLYCSSDTGEDCTKKTNVLRSCILNSGNVGLEYLFHKNKVDVSFSGHMHYYERSWPIYENRIFNGSYQDPYKNPGALIHIITGAAGMKTGTESASYVSSDYFPFYSNEYSYTILTVCNKTHILLEQISASRRGELLDSVWITKDHRTVFRP